jgi:DNA-binding transcriptional LysR family regulator
MELRHLRYFVAIAEEGSFSSAAERLWVAQPGLSTQIRRLEAELGVKLFLRHTRGVDLTDAGELFLERARTALAAAEAALATGHDLEAGLVGTIRLGLATEAGWHLTPKLLAEFGRARPGVEITVFESFGGALLRDLRDGRLDAVLAPSMFGSAELLRERVGREPWRVLAGPGHRLANASGPVAARELEGEALVVTGHRDGAAYDRGVADVLAGLGVAPVLQRGGSGPALIASVAAGDAVALATMPAAASGGIVARPLEPERLVGFELIRRDETPSPALDHFIQVATTIAERTRPALRAAA